VERRGEEEGGKQEQVIRGEKRRGEEGGKQEQVIREE
jgi:hypothetical protein